MRHNNKGFTLVELLVTITIMVSVMALAVVSFTTISKQKKEESFNQVKAEVEAAAEQYFESNSYLFEGLSDNATGVITIGTLVDNDYLNKVTDPRTGKAISNCNYVEVKRTGSKYSGTYTENTDKCDNETSAYQIVVKEDGAPTITYGFYKDAYHIVEAKEDTNGWFNINSLGENGTLYLKLNITNNNGGEVTVLDNTGANIIMNNNNGVYSSGEISDTAGTNYTVTATNSSNKTAILKITDIKKDTVRPSLAISLNKLTSSDNNNADDVIGEYINNTWYNLYEKTVFKYNDNLTSGTVYYDRTVDSDNPDDTYTTQIDISKEKYIRVLKQGTSKLNYKVCDEANNCSGDYKYTIKLDRTSPTCVVSTNGKAKNKNNKTVSNYDGWYTSNVTITLASSDTYSGVNIATLYNSDNQLWNDRINNSVAIDTLNYDTNTMRYYGYVSDNAGNWKSCGINVKRDIEAPKIKDVKYGTQNYTNPETGYVYVAYIDIESSDNLSGVDGVSYRHCYNGSSTESWYCNATSIYDRSYTSTKFNGRLNLRDTSSVKFQFKLFDKAGNFVENDPADYPAN